LVGATKVRFYSENNKEKLKEMVLCGDNNGNREEWDALLAMEGSLGSLRDI